MKFLCFYVLYFSSSLSFIWIIISCIFCPYRLCRMSGSPAKKRCCSIEEDVKVFKKYCTDKFCVIENDNKALCIFCLESVVCRKSSVKRHFESVHNDICNEAEVEQRELISS